MTRRRIAGWLAAVLFAAVGLAHASSVGVFFAPDASDCDTEGVPFVEFQTYVIAQLGGDAGAAGISGAQFRVDGFDPTWFNAVTIAPGVQGSVGNPITGGCALGFQECQPGPNVLLYTVRTVSLEPIPPTTFTVRQHTTPSSPNWPCVTLYQCNDGFSKFCVPGGTAFLNGGSCSVGVAEATWSTVKSLYGNGP